LFVPAVAAAHGTVPPEPPSLATLVLAWQLEPVVLVSLLGAAAGWLWVLRRVRSAHPDHPVPVLRTAAFLGGLAVIAVALLSGIDRYDTTLFSVHMAQHILLMLVAAPLIALAAPVTLMLRVATPATRQRLILPILHSRVVRFFAFPVVAWVLFASAMWVAHFSPLFDAALEDPLIHELEHALFLATALLFWWPAVALDPAPWRMPHPARALYVFLQMPQNTFLAVVILSAGSALYPHYLTVNRSWGPTPLVDQGYAAGIMWLAGDAVFLIAVLAILWGWMRAETRDVARADRLADAERAAIRIRERRLAERLAREREDPQPGSGAAR
jgi:putative copper resistance protein D